MEGQISCAELALALPSWKDLVCHAVAIEEFFSAISPTHLGSDKQEK
jgi:hypothetical protein